MITTETFGLYKFSNSHLLCISKVPDTFSWSFLAQLASVVIMELLKLPIIDNEVHLLSSKYGFNYKC